MISERNYQVLLAPHISEKAALGAEVSGRHVFKVAPDANKIEVKSAVESIFGVSVESVNILLVKGKTKWTKQITGRRKNWKKAVIRLAAGHELDMSSFGGRS